MDATRPWRLQGAIRRYAWGSRTAIPALLGVPPDGTPQAELWLGAHPSAPSRVETDAGPVPLDRWIASDPEAVLGRDVAERFDGQLPFLLKVLAAEAPLSIQAHPSPEQARAGFARENAAGIPLDAPHRCYRDPFAKPELVCALSPFRALNRFRAPEAIERLVAALGVPALDAVLAPLRDAPDRSGLAAFFEGWMTREAEARRAIASDAAKAAEGLRRAPGADPAYAEVARLAEAYPGDAGVIAPLFLNVIELGPGEAMYLPAGELHSYLGGTAIEVMANSDNVLRGGLTPKHVNVPELVATLSFAIGEVERLRPQPVAPAEHGYAAPAEEFSLSILRLEPEASWRSPTDRGVEILICTEGWLRVSASGRAMPSLRRGGSAIVPAAAGAYVIEGEGGVYRVAVGGPR